MRCGWWPTGGPLSHSVSRDDLGGSGPTGKQHTLTRQDVERAWSFPLPPGSQGQRAKPFFGQD